MATDEDRAWEAQHDDLLMCDWCGFQSEDSELFGKPDFNEMRACTDCDDDNKTNTYNVMAPARYAGGVR